MSYHPALRRHGWKQVSNSFLSLSPICTAFVHRFCSNVGSSPPPDWYKRGAWVDPGEIEKRMSNPSPSAAPVKKEPATEVTKQLKAMIRYRGGPVTVAEYMKEVLTNPMGGFYTSGNDDVIGKSGHFVTSPEISNLFADVLGAWVLQTFLDLGKPKKVRFVELGPGKGTLVSQIAMALKRLPGGDDALTAMTFHLVEVSAPLRQAQHDALDCYDTVHASQVKPPAKADEGTTSTDPETGATIINREAISLVRPTGMSKRPHVRSPEDKTVNWSDVSAKVGGGTSASESGLIRNFDAVVSATSRITGSQVTWHYLLDEVPDDAPFISIAHEYLDALPVHQFVKDEKRGWLEVLVDEAQSAEDSRHLEFVMSPVQTAAVQQILRRRLNQLPDKGDGHTTIEVSATAMAVAEAFAIRVAKHGGVALIIDYGKDGPYDRSLNAIRRHEPVHPLESPGEADLTAWIDFDALRQAVAESPSGAVAHGPLLQGHFLQALGMEHRLNILLEKERSEKERAELEDGFARIVAGTQFHPQGMGETYKAMVITPASATVPYPFDLDFAALAAAQSEN